METYLAPEPPEDDDPIDPYGPDSGLAALASFCERARLPLPPLPEALIPLIEQTAETVFASRGDLATLTDLDSLIAEAANGEGAPLVALSHEGVGTNSWYLRYCVALPAMHLFATVPFGGLYMDADSDIATVSNLFEQAATLIERALVGEGERSFVIDYRGIARARWCEVGGDWHDDPDALTTVADKLAA
jgi:hypothetical protein